MEKSNVVQIRRLGNLLLVGPDGFAIPNCNRVVDNDYAAYLDEGNPFGHERVLSCLLRQASPWARYHQENAAKEDTDPTKIVYPSWL